MKNKKCSPLGPMVVVKVAETKKVSDGGIILVDDTVHNRKVSSTLGTIIGIGACAWKDWGDGSNWVEIGDEVVFQKDGNYQIDIMGNGDYRLMKDESILMKVEDNE